MLCNVENDESVECYFVTKIRAMLFGFRILRLNCKLKSATCYILYLPVVERKDYFFLPISFQPFCVAMRFAQQNIHNVAISLVRLSREAPFICIVYASQVANRILSKVIESFIGV